MLQPPVYHAKAASDCYGCVIPALYGTNDNENSFMDAGTINTIGNPVFYGDYAYAAIAEAGSGNGKDNVLVERPAKDRDKQPKSAATAKAGSASSPSDVGAALRKAFQSAVEEDVPDELLDLLRRLD